MSKLIVVTRSGDEVQVDGQSGRTVMELIRDNGVSDLLAICGGARSCATCHVWVDEAFIDKLPELVEDENELLDSSSYRKPTSRLSCQLKWTDALDGMRVTVAPDE